MKIEEIRKKIADTIEEIRTDNENKWIRENCIIDLAFCDSPSYELERFRQWAETTGYWDRLREQAEEDITYYSICAGDTRRYLAAVDSVNGLTDEFENKYDEEMSL